MLLSEFLLLLLLIRCLRLLFDTAAASFSGLLSLSLSVYLCVCVYVASVDRFARALSFERERVMSKSRIRLCIHKTFIGLLLVFRFVH